MCTSGRRGRHSSAVLIAGLLAGFAPSSAMFVEPPPFEETLAAFSVNGEPGNAAWVTTKTIGLSVIVGVGAWFSTSLLSLVYMSDDDAGSYLEDDNLETLFGSLGPYHDRALSQFKPAAAAPVPIGRYHDRALTRYEPVAGPALLPLGQLPDPVAGQLSAAEGRCIDAEDMLPSMVAPDNSPWPMLRESTNRRTLVTLWLLLGAIFVTVLAFRPDEPEARVQQHEFHLLLEAKDRTIADLKRRNDDALRLLQEQDIKIAALEVSLQQGLDLAERNSRRLDEMSAREATAGQGATEDKGITLAQLVAEVNDAIRSERLTEEFIYDTSWGFRTAMPRAHKEGKTRYKNRVFGAMNAALGGGLDPSVWWPKGKIGRKGRPILIEAPSGGGAVDSLPLPANPNLDA